MSFIRIITDKDTEVLINLERILYVTKSLVGGSSNEDTYDFQLAKDSGTTCITGKIRGGGANNIKATDNLLKVQKFLNDKGE